MAVAVTLLGLPGLAGGPGARRGADPAGREVQIQLLGVNDLHGHLEPSEGLAGAAWLAAHLNRAVAADPAGTIRVHAGDMVGASPLVSSHFHDEPTVKAMNLMHFDVGTVGNHEFDEGGAEMLRLIRGGHRRGRWRLKRNAAGVLADTSDPHYAGASFPYVSANAVDRRGRLLLPPYIVVERRGVRVGFIGVTTPTTPRFLLGRFASRYRFLDMSDTVNRYARELERHGVRAIVVLAHSGAFQTGARHARGEIVDETRQMSDAVDVVVAGHSHSYLNDRVGHKLLVEALSYGEAYDRIRLTVDKASGEVTSASAEVPRTWHRGVAPEPQVAALVARYAFRARPLTARVLGSAVRPLAQSELGPLAAAAQRAAARSDVSIVNRADIRDGLSAGPVSYARLFNVHSYENPLLRVRLRGSELRSLLAQHGKDLWVSGRTDRFRADGTYSVAVNELLGTGPSLDVVRRRAAHAVRVGTDLDALVRYVRRLGWPRAPARTPRVLSEP